MDTVVSSARIIPATAVPEGAGVIVHRTIGTPALRNYDPFLLLDHIGSDNPDDYIAGFPPHPRPSRPGPHGQNWVQTGVTSVSPGAVPASSQRLGPGLGFVAAPCK